MYRFLQSLLNLIEQQGICLSLGKELEKTSALWRCQKEVPLPNQLGRADIVLKGPNQIIIIENKIHATDQNEQILRYSLFASQQSRIGAVALVVYLTLDGRAPSKRSLGAELENKLIIVNMSYKNDVIPMLKYCLSEIKAVSVSEVVRQYVELLEIL